MNNQFPIPITTETDLDYYENYLNHEFEEITKNKTQFSDCLKTYIGKTTKINIWGNKPETLIGRLSQVGDDFLLLKSNNQTEIIIPLISVKTLMILQNNTKPPHF